MKCINESPLKNYFLLGDLHSAALLNCSGSVDWLCWPHFDSPSVFARILDPEGGSFFIDMPDWRTRAKYRKDTAIVDTVFRRGTHSFRLTDFMVPQMQEEEVMHLLVRKFRDATERIEITVVCDLKPDYARQKPKLRKAGDKIIISFLDQHVVLHFPKQTRVKIEQEKIYINFFLLPGEEKQMVLEGCKTTKHAYLGEDFEKGVQRYWKQWVKRGHYGLSFRSGLIRSAITLKLMQFYPSGALIAAPTTSLPEELGGDRNWDYRYTWVRDATMTLYALQLLGHREEAIRFFHFIEKVTQKSDTKDVHIKLMYSIGGSMPPDETKLSHLRGYKDSRPVRLGNHALNQFQLDTYGAVLDAYFYMHKKGILPTPPSKVLMTHLVKRIEELWQTGDSGIWEFRSQSHRFTYSRVMGWVGVDRFLMMHKELGLTQKELKHYRQLKKKIGDWIWKNCFDRKRKVFKQHPSSPHLDASAFMFVLLRFLDKRDRLTKEIINNTAKELVHGNIFVYRYINDDGFSPNEGAFILCCYWYVAALAAVGKVSKAEKIFTKFNKLLSENNLIAEEIDPATGEYLGNFPQAFSHIGYIMAAHYIEKMKRKGKRV